MFFGVDIGPRLGGPDFGLDTSKNRDTFTKRRNRIRSKYGVPFTSKWKVEVQNISKDISWQDLKDFCFNRTRVRPSHAELHKDKEKRGVIGTLCCGTESDMKIVLRKLNGSVLKGRSLTTVEGDKSESTSHSNHKKLSSESIRRPRIEDGDKNDHTKNDQHVRRHTHRDIGDGNERQRDQKHDVPPPSSSHRRKDESKVIIHQRNGDKVITETISNYEKDDACHSEKEQAYFKRDQRSNRTQSGADGDSQGGQHSGGSHKNVENISISTKKKAVHVVPVVQARWKIRVENLSSEVNRQDLEDIIRPYADVRHVDVHKRKHGVGIVYVSTQEGLQNAISKLNNSDVKGKVAKFMDGKEKEKLEKEKRERSDKTKRSRSPRRSSRHTEKGNKSSRGK